MKNKEASDPRFHHEIWSGPTDESADHKSGIYYVENHNGQCSYAELATDFEMAAMLAIGQHELDGLGNWTAPIAHLVRQTIELLLKALQSAVAGRGNSPNPALVYSHDLKGIWQHSRDWLNENGYKFENDARLAQTEWLIEAFHEIDPSGDLFRFGISSRSAFGQQKSYDRVGLRMEILEPDFKETVGFLRHWEAVIFREAIAVELNWEEDPYFDPNDFPKRSVLSD